MNDAELRIGSGNDVANGVGGANVTPGEFATPCSAAHPETSSAQSPTLSSPSPPPLPPNPHTFAPDLVGRQSNGRNGVHVVAEDVRKIGRANTRDQVRNAVGNRQGRIAKRECGGWRAATYVAPPTLRRRKACHGNLRKRSACVRSSPHHSTGRSHEDVPVQVEHGSLEPSVRTARKRRPRESRAPMPRPRHTRT